MMPHPMGLFYIGLFPEFPIADAPPSSGSYHVHLDWSTTFFLYCYECLSHVDTSANWACLVYVNQSFTASSDGCCTCTAGLI